MPSTVTCAPACGTDMLSEYDTIAGSALVCPGLSLGPRVNSRRVNLQSNFQLLGQSRETFTSATSAWFETQGGLLHDLSRLHTDSMCPLSTSVASVAKITT